MQRCFIPVVLTVCSVLCSRLAAQETQSKFEQLTEVRTAIDHC